MENKNWKNKLKNIFKERDSRFWLMIFVIISTTTIFVVWSMNLKNIFPEKTIRQDVEDLGLIQVKTEFREDKDYFLTLLKKLEKQNSEEDINEAELEKLKQIIEEKIESNNSLGTSTNDLLSTSSSSSIPVISQDLDNSEQEIEELKRKIEELEKKMGN
jgi:hypothetical protein